MPHQTLRVRLLQADTWILEMFLSLYTLIWGLGFANPLIDTFASAPIPYALLAYFPGGELAFGLTTIIFGAIKMWLIVRGTRRQRAIVAYLLGIVWIAVAVAIGIPSNWAAGGIPHFFLAALANLYVWGRMSIR